jgi:hypothetical protein
MQFLYDNVMAILVGSAVLLILGAIHLRTQNAGAEAGMYYMNRVQTMTLINMIERDFPNIGAGVNPQTQTMISGYSWSENERRFEFFAAIDSAAGAPVQRIQYRVVPAENQTCDRSQVQCYEVQRLIDSGAGFELTGRSNAFVTDFEIELFPTSSPLRDVREVRVRLAALSPSGANSTVGRTSWETRFRPFNLSLLSF